VPLESGIRYFGLPGGILAGLSGRPAGVGVGSQRSGMKDQGSG
jgi:hypothetical protein